MTRPKQGDAPLPPVESSQPGGPDQALLRYLDSLGRNDPTDPYPEDLDSIPYPPTGAREVRLEGTNESHTEAVFGEVEGAEVHARCSWGRTSLTVTWRAVNPNPETSLQIGFGFLDEPQSERWYQLGAPSPGEQIRQFDTADSGFRPLNRAWWWLINVREGTDSDIDP